MHPNNHIRHERMCPFHLLLKKPCITRDRREYIVEIMRYPTGKVADRAYGLTEVVPEVFSVP